MPLHGCGSEQFVRIPEMALIPVITDGHNVYHIHWYDGPTLPENLEPTTEKDSDTEDEDSDLYFDESDIFMIAVLMKVVRRKLININHHLTNHKY